MDQNPIAHSGIVKGKKISAMIILLAGILLLACAFGIYSLFKGTYEKAHAITTVGNKFLDLEKAHDFRDAHDLLAPQAQSTTSVVRMAEIQSLVEKSHGNLIGYSKTSIFFREDNGVSNVRLSYRTTYTKGLGSVQLIVVETPDGWKIYGYNFSL